MSKKLSQNGHQFLHQEEGLKLKAYKDVKGVWTIGYGNTYYENGNKVKENDVITIDRAKELFKIIVSKFEENINKVVKVDINQNQFDALVSFSYNIGISAFNNSTALKRINNNSNDPTIADAIQMWKNSGNNKGILLPRRKRESNLYFS